MLIRRECVKILFREISLLVVALFDSLRCRLERDVAFYSAISSVIVCAALYGRYRTELMTSK
jgi:hypothetical protein